uniref:NACHT domain-containing protein n=1 Tax=Strigamia maritima TaxID=126957 RepID=T1IZ32_STRMM
MGNLSSTPAPKHDGSGTATLNFESAKKIVVETHVDNRSITYSNMPADPEGTTSKHKPRPCCDHIDDNGKQCDVFELKLKQHYEKLVLPKLAWIEEGKNLSIDEHFIQLELHESRKPIKIEEVFDSVDNKRPVRILIEGQPGFGKTTLAIKLTHDWASNKNSNFEFAFLIPLKELQRQSLTDAIQQIGKRCDCEDAMEIVKQHAKSVLLILDGLDEVLQEDRSETMKIVYKQSFSDVTVVVTSRTGLFALSKVESEQLFGSIKMQDDFSDKRISILGILSDRKKREFLQKFVPKVIVEAAIKRLTSSQWDLFNSPLLLMTLSVLIQEGDEMEELSTKTELYKKLFNNILKHSYRKRGHEIDSDFDLFRFNPASNVIRENMRKFGMSAAKQLVNREFKFEVNPLTTEIFELGFLLNHQQITFLKTTNHYEAIHLSVIEFSIAFALSMNLKFNKSDDGTKKCLILIVNHFIQSGGTSLALPFLISLMEDEVENLLSVIDSYGAMFSVFDSMFVSLFSECSLIRMSKSQCLRNFIPSDIEISYCQSNERILGEIINYGADCGKIKRIVIDEFSKFEILPNEINTRLEIRIELNSSTKFSVFSQVPCQSTHMSSRPIPFKGPLLECLRFAALSNCEFCALELESYAESAEFLELVMKDKTIDKIKYKELKIEIRTEMEKQVVIQLLENNQVQYLDLKQEKQKQNILLQLFSRHFSGPDTSDFSFAAAKSNHLTFIELKGVTIDLYDLTRGGIKKYIYVGLVNCTLTCRRPLLAKNCCYRLVIHNLKNLERIIGLEPSVFQCQSLDTMKDLMIKYPDWTGFKTVKCLRTTHGLSNDVLSNSFINLQTLKLFVYKAVHLDELANCIHVLPIVNLVIYNEISSDISNLFERMNNLWSGLNSSRLKTISLFERDANNYFSNAFELLEGLNRCHWDKVNLPSLGTYRDRDKLFKYMSDSSLILFLSKIESIYFEPDLFHNYLLTYRPGSGDMLSITRKCYEEKDDDNLLNIPT